MGGNCPAATQDTAYGESSYGNDAYSVACVNTATSTAPAASVNTVNLSSTGSSILIMTLIAFCVVVLALYAARKSSNNK